MAAKPFAVGDVLPPTTQLRISWNAPSAELVYDLFYAQYNQGAFKSDLDNFSFVTGNSNDLYLNGVNIVYTPDDDNYFMVSPFTVSGGGHAYIDIDTSSWSLSKRTISTIPLTIWNNYFTWEDLAPAPSGYTITFNSNGGTTIPDVEDATELPTPLPIPSKSGYTFVNWYYDSAFTQKATAGDTLESDVTLYAKWHNLGSLFTEIADAIRSKDGTSENIRDVDFGERVKQIQGAIELTQAQYDALETKDANTYYLIVEVE